MTMCKGYKKLILVTLSVMLVFTELSVQRVEAADVTEEDLIGQWEARLKINKLELFGTMENQRDAVYREEKVPQALYFSMKDGNLMLSLGAVSMPVKLSSGKLSGTYSGEFMFQNIESTLEGTVTKSAKGIELTINTKQEMWNNKRTNGSIMSCTYTSTRAVPVAETPVEPEEEVPAEIQESAVEEETETQTAAAASFADTDAVVEAPAGETAGKTSQQDESAAPKQTDPQPDAVRTKEELDREWRKNFMQRDISAQKLLTPEEVSTTPKGDPYGSTMESAAPESKGMDPFGSTMENVDPKKTTIFEIMRRPQGVDFYSASSEKDEEYVNGVLSRAADVAAPPVGAVMGLWSDFTDNVWRGDGVIKSVGKSLSGNFIYGLTGSIGSGIDLVTFSAGGESQHSLQDAVKGNINLIWDITTRVDKEEKKYRASNGHYGYKYRYYDGSADYFKVENSHDPREHERFKHDEVGPGNLGFY